MPNHSSQGDRTTGTPSQVATTVKAFADALWHKGEQAAAKGHWKDAAASMDRSIEAFALDLCDDPHSWQHCFCGAVNVLAKNYEVAIRHLSKLLDDDYFPFRDQRSRQIKRVGDEDENGVEDEEPNTETNSRCPKAYLWGIELNGPLASQEQISEHGPIPMTGFLFGDALCWRGRAFLEQGTPDKALSDFEEARCHLTELVKPDDFFPLDEPIYGSGEWLYKTELSFLWPTYWSGRCYLAKGDYQRALQEFAGVEREGSWYVSERLFCFAEWMCREECCYWSGVALEGLGKFQDAIESYSEAICWNLDDWNAFYRRGRLHYHVAQYDLQWALTHQEEDSGSLDLHKEAEEKARYEIGMAVKDTVEAIWLNPRFLRAYLDFCRLAISHKDTTYQFFQPQGLFWANDYGEAVRFMVDAMTTASSDVLDRLRVALNQIELGSWLVACNVLSELAYEIKTSAAWYFLLGIAQHEREDYQAAEHSFQMALACDPVVVAARYGLAENYKVTHEYDKAEEAVTIASRMRCEVCEHRWRLKQDEDNGQGSEIEAMLQRVERPQEDALQFIRAVDSASGEERRPQAVLSPLFHAPVYSIAFSYTGEYLAAGYNDGAVDVFNTHTNVLVGRVESRARAPATVAFSPDGLVLAIGCGKTVSLVTMDFSTVKLEHDAEVVSVYISQDGLRLGVEVEDNERPLWIWNLRTLTVERTLSYGFRERLQEGLAFVAEDGCVAAFTDFGLLHVKMLQPTDVYFDVGYLSEGVAVERFAFSCDGAMAYEFNYRDQAHVEIAKSLFSLDTHESDDGDPVELGIGRMCSPMPFSKDGCFLATFEKRSAAEGVERNESDGYCCVWRLHDQRAFKISVTINSGRRKGHWLLGFCNGQVPVAFSASTNLVAISLGDEIAIWDLRGLFGEHSC